jgi:glycosyltransferase involved in cell wall biosynthesis
MNQAENSQRKLLVILPSLRQSGGVMEALRLAEELQNRSIPVAVLVLWRCDHEIACPNLRLIYLTSLRTTHPARPLQYIYILASFLLFALRDSLFASRRWRAVFLTHFSTFPLGWLTPWADRYCFNQDIEWMFVPAGLRRRLLRWMILATSRRSYIVTTNTYIDRLYRDFGIHSIGEAAIWAQSSWLLAKPPVERDIDVVMLVRRGHMKRLDLYGSALTLLNDDGISTAAISPDADIDQRVRPLATLSFLRPSNEELQDIYRSSKVFLLLSDTEGFALPPLEAMGAGCVPLCRDSGGPRCYMDGPFAANLIPLDANADEIVRHLKALLADPAHLANLSTEAKQRFAEGLTSSLQRRSACMDALAQRLRQAP